MANRALIEREIKEYCKVNGINDVAGFITQCLLRGFNIFRYGNSPSDNKRGKVVKLKINLSTESRSQMKSQLSTKKTVIVKLL